MGWLIALMVLTALAVLPLGVGLRYNADGFFARVRIGPVDFAVFPRPNKKKKQNKKEKSPEEKQSAGSGQKAVPGNPKPPAPPKNTGSGKEQGGSWTDFLPLVKLALKLLGDLRRKLRVDRLELKLIMAADDPCDLAVSYGRAWTAVGNLMPQLERLFVIKKREVEVACDFTASGTRVIARVDLTVTLGRLVSLAVVYGLRALMEFLKIKKKRKGGAVT